MTKSPPVQAPLVGGAQQEVPGKVDAVDVHPGAPRDLEYTTAR